MTKFRFPGRTTKHAVHRTRVPGIRQGTDEAAITAEKIFFVYRAWQHLFEDTCDEHFEGFTKSEAQQAVTLAINTTENNDLESEAFIERLQEIEVAQNKLAKKYATPSKLRKAATGSTSKSDTSIRKISSRNQLGLRAITTPNKSKFPENTENETENSTQKYGSVKFDFEYKNKSLKSSKSAEKRLCKNSSTYSPDYKKFKSCTDTSPKNSSIILKPSTLKFESFNSGYTLGSNWLQATTPTVKPTSLPDSKGCIICEKMTSDPDVQCDWCRGFMEKMLCKNTQKLICLRGRGICKIAHTELKARCHACWLTCCLTKLPVANKTLTRLKKCLPNSLQYQIGPGIPVKKDPLRGCFDNFANQTQLAARALMRRATKTVNNKNKVHEIIDTSKKKSKLKEKPKRQKTHLKGPRIKHVCRSASVVLGQPQATFPVSPDAKSAESFTNRKTHKEESKTKGDKKAKSTSDPPQSLMLPPDMLGLPVAAPSKTDTPPGWICLDYEPADGTCVPVITTLGSSTLPPALCLLCGSAGKEQLLFCAMCCEPYHVYCLEVTPQLNKMWICERCELCSQCNSPTQHHNDIIRCHKCAAPYHKHCLTIKPSTRPWECPTCNVCRSCGEAANNMHHVGNTAFCLPCYKLRLKGNFCPLCQQCYQDDDYDTKMVECAECLSWVHARCEQISDEKYQILSHLPESVEFHCKNCCTQSPAPWQIAVDNEIKNGVVTIMKNLAKYRSIKVTPHKVDRSNDYELKSTETSKIEVPSKSPINNKSDAIQPQQQQQTGENILVVQNQSDKPKVQVSEKVPEPNEKSKSDENIPAVVQSVGALNTVNVKDPKIEAAKVKLDFSEESMKLPRLVVKLTDYVKQKPKATQTLKLKQICDAYNIKECSVHLRKCNIDNVQTNEKQHKSDETPAESTSTENNTILPIFKSPSLKTPDKNANYDMRLTEASTSAEQAPEAVDSSSTLNGTPSNLLNDLRAYRIDSNKSETPTTKQETKSPSKETDVERGEMKKEVSVIEVENRDANIVEKKPPQPPPLPKFDYPSDSPRFKVQDGSSLDVKQLALTLRKANLGFYDSLITFDLEFQNEILKCKSTELKNQYLKLLIETFPWYKPGEHTEVLDENLVVPKTEPNTSFKEKAVDSLKTEAENSWSQLYLPGFNDDRVCALCKEMADRNIMTGERMLHTGLAPPLDWVHASCALWSSEVWEDRDGFLHSLAPSAIARSNKTSCALCGNKGATIGCCHGTRCPNSYHWPCAISLLVPQEGKRVGLDPGDMSLFCTEHCFQHLPELETEEHEYNFALPRKLRIEPPKSKKRYADPDKIQIAVGSLRIEHLGVLNSALCHDEARDILVPDGYAARRLFWSTKEPWRIVEYILLTELEPEINMEESLGRDINMTVEHGTHGAPQEVLEKNLRMLRHIQQQELDQARDPDLNNKENADDLLLPPDLKETIFQDLNSELLDGISMQDIFTKLLSDDAIKEEVLSDSEDVVPLSYNPVKECVDNLVDQVCMIETLDPNPSKRYYSSDSSDDEQKNFFIKTPGFYSRLKRIPQFDGADDSSSDSESATKSDEMKVEVETSLTRKIKERSLAASEPCNEGPVRCEICKRTYRTKTSYDKHLSSCTEVSSDSSDESSESPTTQRMTTKTSKYGTVVVKTKLVLLPSPDKNKEKRKAAKLVRKTVRLAAKPSDTPVSQPQTTQANSVSHVKSMDTPTQINHNIVFQEQHQQQQQQPVIVGQNPIFLAAQPTNTVYYINVTPNKQNYYVVNNPESPGQLMYVQAPDQDNAIQNPIIFQPSSPFNNVVTLNPSFTSGQSFCQSPINAAFLPTVNQNITYSPSQQAFTPAFTPEPGAVQPLANPIITPNTGGIFLSSNAGISPQTFTVNQQPQSQTFTVNQQPSGQTFTVNQQPQGQTFTVNQQPQGQTFTVNQQPQGQTFTVNQQPSGQTFITTSVNPTNLTQNLLPTNLNITNQEPQLKLVNTDKLQEQTYVVHTPQDNIKPIIQSPQEQLIINRDLLKTQENLLLNANILANQNMVKTQDNVIISPNIQNQIINSSIQNQIMNPNIQNTNIIKPTDNVIIHPSLLSNPSIQGQGLIKTQDNVIINPNILANQIISKAPEQQMVQVPQSPIPRYTIQTPDVQCLTQQSPIHLQQHLVTNQIAHPQIPTSSNQQQFLSTNIQQGMLPLGSYYSPNHHAQQQQFYPMHSPQQHQIQLRPTFNFMQRQPQMPHVRQYHGPPRVLYKRATSGMQVKSKPLQPPTITTATRLYVQPSPKTYSNITKSSNIKPVLVISAPQSPRANETKVVKITASASVGTQTTRCATPSSIKKEPLDCDDKTGIQFKIFSSDGFTTVAHNVNQAWQNIFDAVQKARRAYNLSPLPYNPFSLSGQHMSGLSQDSVKFLLEQLPGVNKCDNYLPKFHNSSQKDMTKKRLKEPKLNPTGCARTEIFKSRNPYDMFGWLASTHRKPPPIKPTEIETSSRRASNSSLPMAMRFRQLKNSVKVKVGVFRSPIHGRGLYCLRELEPAEMVIEYAGEVIRSALTDKREKIYESRGIGCYMFRIDDYTVVDATMKGNAARFINHSCEPNCYSRVVDILGKKHILIFALRRILPGEELTYDYKFPFEEDKIPCTCASRKCRKYLN